MARPYESEAALAVQFLTLILRVRIRVGTT